MSNTLGKSRNRGSRGEPRNTRNTQKGKKERKTNFEHRTLNVQLRTNLLFKVRCSKFDVQSSVPPQAILPKKANKQRTSNFGETSSSKFEVQSSKFKVRSSKLASSPWVWYALTLLFFALGLMSKPMLVTVPFLLLLLDFWPLGRISAFNFQLSAFRDKLPFLGLAAVSSVVTFLVQDKGKAVGGLTDLALGSRVANAVESYVQYLAKTFWPTDLAVFYPHPYLQEPTQGWPEWQLALGVILLVGISVSVVARFRREPYLAVGWFWFLGMLVPVIGLVQVGSQGMADRYMYLPIIGLLVCVTWAIAESLGRTLEIRIALRGMALICVAACAWLTRTHIGYWQDDIRLFSRAVEVTRNNSAAHFNLGTALGKQGKIEEAVAQLQKAVAAAPGNVNAQYSLGFAYLNQNKAAEAIVQFERTLAAEPDHFRARYYLGTTLLTLGRAAEAESHLREAVKLMPDAAGTHLGLGRALAAQNKLPEAVQQFDAAVRLQPDPETYFNLGLAWSLQGRQEEAARAYREALKLAPDSVQALNDLAWILATSPAGQAAGWRGSGEIGRASP